MRHLVAVLLDTDTEPHRCKISHHKNVFFDPSDNEKTAELLSKDINTLATGIVMAIREGGERGVLDKVKTLHSLIDYFSRSISVIDLSQTTAESIVYGDTNIAKR